ncbi:PadR family transcriptional regulator [Paenibacillus lignilyticus]|uniref:PadR family transcriptional regulator n=1 Tax=Paenibacillus lignilyticus TaxID=1172615 RepID=A0ABS5CAB9_9BACL|nr:PadR family transcriptional regulator [Paenibacillus lignilyticus]MBP3962939.1 PadR family transcriptional regulator [Paenibacillus lignilyticus]
MKIQGVILGILNSGPHSGYEIKRYFEERFSFFFDASFGTIYPTLRKMETEYLITKKIVKQEGKPDKNIYNITDTGVERFQEYLNAPLEKEVSNSDFLMRLYFGDMATRETMEMLLCQALREYQDLYDKLNEKYEQYEDSPLIFQKSCIELGLIHYDSFIQKIKSILTVVEKKK